MPKYSIYKTSAVINVVFSYYSLAVATSSILFISKSRQSVTPFRSDSSARFRVIFIEENILTIALADVRWVRCIWPTSRVNIMLKAITIYLQCFIFSTILTVILARVERFKVLEKKDS